MLLLPTQTLRIPHNFFLGSRGWEWLAYDGPMAHQFNPLTLDSNPDFARATYLQAVLDRLPDAQGPIREASREEVLVNDTWLRIHRPRTNAFGNPPGVVVFVRGGYGALGNRDTHDWLAKRYVDLPAVVISVDIPNESGSFEDGVQAVLTAIAHADNAPLIRTTLQTQVAFVGVDVGASLALEAAARLAEAPTLDDRLTNAWTVKGVHLVDPITNPAMVDIANTQGLVSGEDVARLVGQWPGLEDAQAALAGLEALPFPVLVSVSTLHPGADAAEEVYRQLAAIDAHQVLGMSVGIEGAETVLVTKDHPVAQGAIHGLVQAFGALVALPSDALV